MIITDSTIEKNSVWSVYYSGGGGLSNRGNATIFGTSIIDNYVDAYEYGSYGGGVYNGYNGVLNIVNSTITYNNSTTDDTETYSGGGGLANVSQMTITNSTIGSNQGDGVFTTCGGTAQFNRTIASGNTGYEAYADERDYYCPVEVVVNNFNVFGESGDAGMNFALGASDIVPSVELSSIVSPLANNDGPTQTHALPAGSPAIDRAPNNQCTAAPVNHVDQRSSPRNSNGNGSSSSNECDIGAFELQGQPPAAAGFFVSASGSGTVGGVGFDAADILNFAPASAGR